MESAPQKTPTRRSRQALFKKYSAAMAYVVVEAPDGKESIGSAFHVGEGVYVTARHVVEGLKIKQVKATEPVPVSTREFMDFGAPEQYDPEQHDKEMRDWLGFTPMWKHFQDGLNLATGPVFHHDHRLDVAAFSVKGQHNATPFVPLGSHLDDWIRDEDWMLSEAIVLGYPPIPYTLQPHLVAVKAEVNAVVMPRDAPKVHFIISAIPRGGFSGGLVISEHDFALGLVSRSLLRDQTTEELGFFSVLSIEPILECLASNKLLPEVQREGWDDFWNTASANFVSKKSKGDFSREEVAYVRWHNDGKRLYADIWAKDPPLSAAALKAAEAALPVGRYRHEKGIGASTRLMLLDTDATAEMALDKACTAARGTLEKGGLEEIAVVNPS